ncbi:MAG: HNH endonuclease [Acidobacteria bacterium]|nr:HNH endonuclease [Acidobacteriota bacterium]
MQLIDPSPNARQQVEIWEYFRSRCAYCDRSIDKTLKQGHIDHLSPASAGGRNHVANRVLACATCNEQEKREMHWEDFLRQKAGDSSTFLARRIHIEAWQRRHEEAGGDDDNELRVLATEAADRVNAVFDDQVAQLREARRAQKRGAVPSPGDVPSSTAAPAAGRCSIASVVCASRPM